MTRFCLTPATLITSLDGLTFEGSKDREPSRSPYCSSVAPRATRASRWVFQRWLVLSLYWEPPGLGAAVDHTQPSITKLIDLSGTSVEHQGSIRISGWFPQPILCGECLCLWSCGNLHCLSNPRLDCRRTEFPEASDANSWHFALAGKFNEGFLVNPEKGRSFIRTDERFEYWLGQTCALRSESRVTRLRTMAGHIPQSSILSGEDFQRRAAITKSHVALTYHLIEPKSSVKCPRHAPIPRGYDPP
jgi:hypothetical protein